jgi:hypothetical protein
MGDPIAAPPQWIPPVERTPSELAFLPAGRALLGVPVRVEPT